MNSRCLRLGMVILAMCLLAGCAKPTARDTQAESPAPRVLVPIIPKRIPQRDPIDFPTAPPTATVEIVADVPGVDFSTWQNTGVSLRDKDVLYIRAEGQVNYVNNVTVGPDGRGDTFAPSLLPRISFMALIGRTHWGLLDDGEDSSNVGVYGRGFVGAEFRTVYRGRSGFGLTGDNILYLAINDSMDNDNALSYTAHIWVVRDAEVVPNAHDAARLDATTVLPAAK